MINLGTNLPANTKPRFFYGYIVVAAAFLVMMLSFGIHNSFGVFLNPLITEFGWSRAVTSGTFSLSMVVYGALSIVMGGLSDKFGPRMVVTCCGFFLGTGFLLMSQVNATWQLYLFYGVLTGIGTSGIWVPQLSTVARWFVRRRSLMSGIVVAGMGIGSLIAPPIINRLVNAFDWRMSYIITGSTALLVVVLAAQLLKRDPSKKGLLPYGEAKIEGKQPVSLPGASAYSLQEAVHTSQFWLALAMSTCRGFTILGVTVHIVPHAIDLGISTSNAANILAAIGGMGIIGNLGLGSLGDKIGSRWIYIISFTLMTAAFLCLMIANEIWMLLLFSIIFGLAHGGMTASGSPLLARLFGLGSHGLLLGIVGLGFRIGAATGPYLFGYIFDLTGSYRIAFIIGTAVSFAGIIINVLLRPTKKIGGRI